MHQPLDKIVSVSLARANWSQDSQLMIPKWSAQKSWRSYQKELAGGSIGIYQYLSYLTDFSLFVSSKFFFYWDLIKSSFTSFYALRNDISKEISSIVLEVETNLKWRVWFGSICFSNANKFGVLRCWNRHVASRWSRLNFLLNGHFVVLFVFGCGGQLFAASFPT
jgi:hypothetical protein